MRRATDMGEPRFVLRALRKLPIIRYDACVFVSRSCLCLTDFRSCYSAGVSGAALKGVIAKELVSGEDVSFAALLPDDDGSAQAMDTEPDVAATTLAAANGKQVKKTLSSP